MTFAMIGAMNVNMRFFAQPNNRGEVLLVFRMIYSYDFP